MIRSVPTILLASAVAAGKACERTAAQALPAAIDCYWTATNSRDIDAYVACFTEDALMIDVSREFRGKEKIRAWALREVIPHGDTATDFSFYSKRGLLAGVYSSTLLFWLNDTSEGFAETLAFLDRRIDNVMNMPRLGGRLKAATSAVPNPFRIVRGLGRRRRRHFGAGVSRS